MSTRAVVHELPGLRGCVRAFRDREHAGATLARMLRGHVAADAVVLAIPAGGVPVAVPIARDLSLPLQVAPVSKVLLPWTTEAGCGAVAFDGSVLVDEDAVAQCGVGAGALQRSIGVARDKVATRVRQLAEGVLPDVAGREAIVVDDGIAAGFTMRAAIRALRRCGASRVVIAVPTAYARALDALATVADAIHCASVREGRPFAVADAYATWADVSDADAAAILAAARRG